MALRDLVNWLFGKPPQPKKSWLYEIRAAEVLLRLPGGRPVRGVEIGCDCGYMSHALLKREDLFLIMVDAWEGGGASYADPANDYHARLTQKQQDERKSVAAQNTKYAAARRAIFHARSVLAATQIPPASLDFVFIDADHSYEGCRADIEAWWPTVVPGGLFGGHDYGSGAFPGVTRAVCEFIARTGLDLSLGCNTTWFVTKPRIA